MLLPIPQLLAEKIALVNLLLNSHWARVLRKDWQKLIPVILFLYERDEARAGGRGRAERCGWSVIASWKGMRGYLEVAIPRRGAVCGFPLVALAG